MDALATAFIAIGLLLILVLIIYLVDRVNTIEKETRKMALSIDRPPQGPKLPFAGLDGRRLWDALNGRGGDNISLDALAEMRERYDLVLHKHLEAIYKDGWRDGERGTPSEPSNIRQIATATAQLESWLPMPQVKTIYQCGFEAASRPPELWESLRNDLDDAANILYAKTQLDVRQPLSGWLMPAPLGQSALLDAPAADSSVNGQSSAS